MLQQYHWITGWWQPRYERPLSFVEDDKLRPGEDVTSGKRRCRSFSKFRSKIRNGRHQTSTFKMADPAGTKTVEDAKKGRTVPDPARETDLVVPDTRRNSEEAKKNKTTGCVIPSKDVLEGPKEIDNSTVVCPKTLETL